MPYCPGVREIYLYKLLYGFRFNNTNQQFTATTIAKASVTQKQVTYLEYRLGHRLLTLDTALVIDYMHHRKVWWLE